MASVNGKNQDSGLRRNTDPELQSILEEVNEVSWRPMFYLAFGVLSLWGMGLIPWYLQQGAWPWELEWRLSDASKFGDSFGFINSLMSSLALVGVIAAIWLQKQELMEQRKELIITRRELKDSATAQKASQKELAKQAKCNLHATILTALNGIERSTSNTEPDERDRTAQFVSYLRQTLIVNILDEDQDSHEVTQQVSSLLNQWKLLTYVIQCCGTIVRDVDHLLFDGFDFTSPGGTRKIKIDANDIDPTQYRNLLSQLATCMDRLSNALKVCGLPGEELQSWLVLADSKSKVDDCGDLLDRLKDLKKKCEGLGVTAKHQRMEILARV